MLGRSASMEDRTAAAMKGGAISILITSATDALAFLIGSSTVMPALRWFCLFAGMGIIFCFVFQVICFVPFLVLNAKRAEAGRLDCLCCIKAKVEVHELEEPNGCCGLICAPKGGAYPEGSLYKVDKLGTFLSGVWGPFITSVPGLALTAVVFITLLILSILGCLYIPVPAPPPPSRPTHTHRRTPPNPSNTAQITPGLWYQRAPPPRTPKRP